MAKKLQLPFSAEEANFDYFLILTDDYLGLLKKGSKNPFFIDFFSGKMNYRRKHASFKNELLVKALGLKKNKPVTLVDATAGLGRDSFILAALGFEVQLIERSKIAYALLEDSLARASHHTETKEIVARMHLIQADAIEWLQKTDQEIDIIYLDPMFPERQKSAKVKKEMQIFQDIIGADPDIELLLKRALTCAKERVVVKRPRLAEAIAGQKPSYEISGKSSRFDIYIT